MATRVYFATGVAAVTPAYSASWTYTAEAGTRRRLAESANVAFSTVSYGGREGNAGDNLVLQFVSRPLDGAVSFNAGNTLKAQMRCRELNATNDLFLTFGVRIVSNDGLTVRGTIIDVTRDDVEMVAEPTVLTNRRWTGTTSAVSALAGDRIVVEMGAGAAAMDTEESDYRIGGNAATDLLENDTATSDDNPWIEFVEDFNFEQINNDQLARMGFAASAGGTLSWMW